MNMIFFLAFTLMVSTCPKVPVTMVHEPSFVAITDPTPYFKANSMNPSWNLTITSAQIEFVSLVPGFENFSMPHVEPVRAADRSHKIYWAKSEEVQMEIEIAHQNCTNDGSNESFMYEVRISILRADDANATAFIGCGRYITDEKIRGRWILTQLKNQPFNPDSFSQVLPSLEIVSNSNSFSGFAGCNKMSGRIFSERSLLRFTDFVTTKMSCGQMELETAYISALQFTTQFEVKEDQLILSNPGEITLIMRRE